MRYSAAINQYERYLIINGNFFFNTFGHNLKVIFFFLDNRVPLQIDEKWETCCYLSTNIFRKVEKDWKMAYLARTEDAHFASISWNFDFSDSDSKIKHVTLVCSTTTFENGQISVQILDENGKNEL